MIDYGMLDEHGVITKQARFCAITQRLLDAPAITPVKHRVPNTQYYFITDATIPVTNERKREIITELLAQVEKQNLPKRKLSKSQQIIDTEETE